MTREIIAATGCILALVTGAPYIGDGQIALRDLVPAGDPLAQQDLRFDAGFAATAVDYVRHGDSQLLDRLSALPAAQHLLNHARQFDYDIPKDSASALVRDLLAPSPALAERADEVERSIAFFTGPLVKDLRWVDDVLWYLPATFRFHGALYLTFGYDIGVALAPNASLNGASSRFDGKPRELLYYAIHELHHVGQMTYQPPPRIADIHTCADVLRQVDYSTELEGIAVLAARPRRAAEHALEADADYVALEDPAVMRVLEQRYRDAYQYLKRRGRAPADAEALAVMDRMSSGDRLWYRVGALMAERIERALGHDALIAIVTKDHPTLVDTYWTLQPKQ